MSLLVERAGALASLQDGGRMGVRHLGVTQGGPVDWVSHGWANWLLGNPVQAATVEITLGNFSLRAETDACLAICGADLGATLDDEAIAPGHSFEVRKGQLLTFAHPKRGARAYLAAPGGFQATPVLGSCATVRREQLGGLDGSGQALFEGDRLHWLDGVSAAPRELPAQTATSLSSPTLAVVLGAQIGDFSGQSLFDTFNSDWTVDQRADRMGVRLRGPVLHSARSSMISEGVPLAKTQTDCTGGRATGASRTARTVAVVAHRNR